MADFLIQIIGAIARGIVEFILGGIFWMAGACTIKLFTLGNGRTGKLRYSELFAWSKKDREALHEEGIDFANEVRLANRTMLVGMGVIFIPIMALLTWLTFSILIY